MTLWNSKSEVKKMSPRTGRPKADNPKDIDLKVRVDKNTNDALEKYSQKNNITKAETVRRGIKLLLQKE
jgi:hypothetical protein